MHPGVILYTAPSLRAADCGDTMKRHGTVWKQAELLGSCGKTDSVTKQSGNKLIRTLPGLLVSAFFLWYTFRGVSVEQIRRLRFEHPIWIFGILLFTCLSYGLRCVRWTRMMRPTRANFAVCARVLMTSLAANNILPLRIGDIMRVFTYAGDLGTSPSVILSTVILEKLFDIFILVLLFVATMGSIATPRLHTIAYVSLGISAIGLMVLLIGARLLQPKLPGLFRGLPSHAFMTKMERWIALALDATARLGIGGSLVLLAQSAVIWGCEGMIFVSALRLTGVRIDAVGPWLAVAFANLSYLIPSSPGAIGPFELAVKTSLVSHGAAESVAAVFALALHAWLLASVTAAGGVIFLLHRLRTLPHKPLLDDIETLPETLP